VTIIHQDTPSNSLMPKFTMIERKVERVYPFLRLRVNIN
jgi:hypothetical protein